jgi:hypothetical protein
MLHLDLRPTSHTSRLLALGVVALAAATMVFELRPHPQTSAPVTLAAPISPDLSMGRAARAHDDSLPDTADTLSHERLPDEEPAATF